MARYCALVPGVTGVVGKGLARYLMQQGDWEVIGIARRLPPAGENVPYEIVSADLTDAAACRSLLAGQTRVTHVLYGARAPHTASTKEPIDTNLAMLRNVMDAVEPVAAGLHHVHLVEGSKYYGSDLGPYKTPAKESDPRIAENNWYFAQEDFIVDRCRGKRWTWSASRPHGIIDKAPVPRSIAMVVATYAAVMKELGEPLYFPGTPANFHALYQCSDATLLAKSIAWMSTTPACANQGYNVTNGDFIRWENLWPAFARAFGMAAGPVKTMRLAEVMKDKAPVWERIVAKHNLKPTPYAQAALWSYGDFIFTPGWDIMSDTLKLRQTGFADCLDTGQMFVGLFDLFRRERIIP